VWKPADLIDPILTAATLGQTNRTKSTSEKRNAHIGSGGDTSAFRAR
jgi:hypothetical protein